MFAPSVARSERAQCGSALTCRSQYQLGFETMRPADIENQGRVSAVAELQASTISSPRRIVELSERLGGPSDKATHRRTNPSTGRWILRWQCETARFPPADWNTFSGNS